MNFSGLRTLFGNGALPVVVSDSPYVLDRFDNSGFRTLSLDAVSKCGVEAPEDVLLIPALSSKHPDEDLLAALRHSAVLVIPMLAFDAGKRAIDYMVDRLSKLSFTDACEKNLALVEHIQNVDGPITVRSAGCQLVVELGCDVDIMVPKVVPDISHGQWISIIQYLEVGIVPNASNTSFRVNGTLLCEGVTIAHHLHSHFQSGPIAEEAWRLFNESRINDQFPLVMEIEDSRLKAVRNKDGNDIINHILPLTDEIKRGELTEVAFAALSASEDTDWSLNSQLNEPAGGFHIGIGAGESAAHIDFVSPYAVY